MRSLLVVTLLAGVAVIGVVHSLPEREAAADVGRVARPQEVESVALEGRGLPLPALRAVLATRTGDIVDRAALDHDRAALAAVLVARGYLDAQVAPAHIDFDVNGGVFVTFAISQGPEFHVRSVELTGAGERDAGVVTLAAGQVAQADHLAQARDALADRLAARGKRRPVTIQVTPDHASATVDVQLVVGAAR
jgi:outer membrane protein assembly factor BamA